ncbi:RIO1 family regulatory kinase/ATPase [Pyxidicoccus caerfyrddinensis]|uniref:RIO1 family regulatory kinase/ATPase domain-containing protein n=1 Tax=Pyxidicoccus caerfyrddinensis TaxID=2709663 RepID=UPI0013D9BB5E|nr:RIO1 family regulatory kinase/ATPase [Pyxidicoccus caerfyrddinensis]
MNDSLETLLADGIIEAVIGQLKTGKEAEVWLVQHAGEVVAAKLYKERHERNFRNNVGYREGREVRNSRTRRAMEKGSRFGQAAAEEAWKSAESDSLYKLYAQGVRVPQPVLFYEGILLMEVVLDAQGQPAPRLVEAPPATPEEAQALYVELRSQVVNMLCADLIHGDLSPFNILMSWQGATIIDFPQTVAAARNNQAEFYFRRDLDNVRNFLAGIAPWLYDAESDTSEIWNAYVRRELTRDFTPRRNGAPGRGGVKGPRDGRQGFVQEHSAPAELVPVAAQSTMTPEEAAEAELRELEALVLKQGGGERGKPAAAPPPRGGRNRAGGGRSPPRAGGNGARPPMGGNGARPQNGQRAANGAPPAAGGPRGGGNGRPAANEPRGGGTPGARTHEPRANGTPGARPEQRAGGTPGARPEQRANGTPGARVNEQRGGPPGMRVDERTGGNPGARFNDPRGGPPGAQVEERASSNPGARANEPRGRGNPGPRTNDRAGNNRGARFNEPRAGGSPGAQPEEQRANGHPGTRISEQRTDMPARNGPRGAAAPVESVPSSDPRMTEGRPARNEQRPGNNGRPPRNEQRPGRNGRPPRNDAQAGANDIASAGEPRNEPRGNGATPRGERRGGPGRSQPVVESRPASNGAATGPVTNNLREARSAGPGNGPAPRQPRQGPNRGGSRPARASAPQVSFVGRPASSSDPGPHETGS